ncbi:acrylate utilization transcriptional regulator AcuR [Granulosicoccus sp. 3-233]|uniref:acrylate utilization transcriptional regulator AcuR n=1 Tax=Granulosicoccus sp. 3-233 TaxID=3417969 RepID=UPI003D329D06
MDNTVRKRRRGRPPKEQAGHSETRQALLKAGVAALTEKGFSATGIDEILRSVDVPKGSFYHYFKSKEAFGAELIEHYARYFSTKLDRILLNESRSPLERLQDFFQDAEDGMRRYHFSRGCLVGNLGQEMGALPAPYRTQLTQVFQDWQSRTSACFQLAREQGEIASDIDCDEAAEYFWIGWEGAVLRAKLEQSDKPLRLFARHFIAGISP